MADGSTVPLIREDPADFTLEGRSVRFAAEPGLGIAKMQIMADDPDAWFASALDIGAPPVRCEIQRGPVSIAWLAPGEWLVTGLPSDVERVRRRSSKIAGALGLMTDLTHGRVSFLLSGATARAALATHCPLDAGDAAMPVGAAARSLFSDTGFFLSRRSDCDGWPCFRLIFDQTMAGFAERMLVSTITGNGL